MLKASYPRLMKGAYDEAVIATALHALTTANPQLIASGTYYLAESPMGQVIGCGGWTREAPGSGAVQRQVGHIKHFATDPTWTRLGVGSAIYAVCESEARAAGITAFTCYSSLNAVTFYAALGFEKVDPIDVPIRPGVVLPAMLMRRAV